MNPLLRQFVSESREVLQGIGEKLMQLESAPSDAALMNELFRLVHTQKGNSGLFDLPEMTQVLHASEDVMDNVREGHIVYSRGLADCLLDAIDFVGILCDELEKSGVIDSSHSSEAARLTEALRGLLRGETPVEKDAATASVARATTLLLNEIPEEILLQAFRRGCEVGCLNWLVYKPEEECFYQGDDPLYLVRQTPDLIWSSIKARKAWPQLTELDAYRCLLDFHVLSSAPQAELSHLYRYVPSQVSIEPLQPHALVLPKGDPQSGPVDESFISEALRCLETGDLPSLRDAALSTLQHGSVGQWSSSVLRWIVVLIETSPENLAALRLLIDSLRSLTPPDWSATGSSKASAEAVTVASEVPSRPAPHDESEIIASIFSAQRYILSQDDTIEWKPGKIKAVAATLVSCCQAIADFQARNAIDVALEDALVKQSSAPLLAWLDANEGRLAGMATGERASAHDACGSAADLPAPAAALSRTSRPLSQQAASTPHPAAATDDAPKFGRRAEDQVGNRSLRVDQEKINRLMDLIGEMVVSKNALPYVAQKAEDQYGVREVAREIKAQYAVINRIVEEMQGAIMQVRMMPVSFVFQRFPRLVRDTSRKLGKEVQLVLEGEDTEADKTVIESLADPLIHIVRNSLDHGLETPEVRQACGKPSLGTLTIRAKQEAERVLLEITDDGKGIDPKVIKRKAYEKGILDGAALDRISDREAVNLIFKAGFSTAETVSDLSGRGVGMDVVRTGVEKVGGSIQLESTVSKGTSIRISLPLSIAITNVMVVETDGQLFGVPMDHVVETVRIPRSAIRGIKQSLTTVLRGRIVPLKFLNTMLGLAVEPKIDDDGRFAVLVARVGNEVAGLVLDDFHKTVDVIQKPLDGVLTGLTAYSGSALLGDGSVLMVLNLKEII